MIPALISSVIWPPGYYILRDRIPFFLTIIYIYRDKLPKRVQNILGYYLFACTCLTVIASMALHFLYDDLILIAGIHWSTPSPIEWGVLIIASTILLYKRGFSFFIAYYIAFITAMAGGWLYEFVPLIVNNFNLMIFFKVNAVKVFFIEFQVLCVPILLYFFRYKVDYYSNRYLLPVGVFTTFFYSIKPIIEYYVRQFYIYSYRWYIRVPMILFLYLLIDGIRGEKQI